MSLHRVPPPPPLSIQTVIRNEKSASARGFDSSGGGDYSDGIAYSERSRQMSKPNTDINMVVLSGRLAAEPEIIQKESFTKIKWLIVVRQDDPARIDVLAAHTLNPTEDEIEKALNAKLDNRIWIMGDIRRSWSGEFSLKGDHSLVTNQVVVFGGEV